MTRDEKWGRAWFALEQVYLETRGAEGERKFLNEQRNFTVHPATVFYSLYESIQPECVANGIPLGNLTAAIARLDKTEFTSEALGEGFVYAYMQAETASRAGIGGMITEARRHAGMTQKELAEKAGTVQENIARWEKGTRTPRMSSLRKLAEALGCSVDDLAP